MERTSSYTTRACNEGGLVTNGDAICIRSLRRLYATMCISASRFGVRRPGTECSSAARDTQPAPDARRDGHRRGRARPARARPSVHIARRALVPSRWPMYLPRALSSGIRRKHPQPREMLPTLRVRGPAPAWVAWSWTRVSPGLASPVTQQWQSGRRPSIASRDEKVP